MKLPFYFFRQILPCVNVSGHLPSDECPRHIPFNSGCNTRHNRQYVSTNVSGPMEEVVEGTFYFYLSLQLSYLYYEILLLQTSSLDSYIHRRILVLSETLIDWKIRPELLTSVTSLSSRPSLKVDLINFVYIRVFQQINSTNLVSVLCMIHINCLIQTQMQY